VLGELKTKSGKNLFRILNEHSKELQAKQEEIAKKYNALSVKYEELKHLKVNMNEYLGRDKREKKESVIEKNSRYKEQDKKFLKRKRKDERSRKMNLYCVRLCFLENKES